MDGQDLKPEQAATQNKGEIDLPIDGLELVAIAGIGGMGTVYRAWQTALGRIVAVKILHKHLLHNQTLVKRFNQEARLATMLSHPNIVPILSFGIIDTTNQPYLVMDYLEGSNLSEYLVARGPLSFEQCVPIFSQCCAALQHAHE